jgi:2-keto-3-deoxy-L-rhamnonate aldolase RhmA
MAKNRLRQRLRDKETTYGLWVTLESPSLSEIAVTLGLDWVCIDMEHGHLGYKEVMEHIRAVRGTETSAIVRVPEITQSAIKRTLDIGAHGVIMPLIRTREDVERGLGFARYPPKGSRGVGGERAVKWGVGLQDYVSYADEETLVIPLIETRDAAENIDSILSVPGIEAIFFGPADLSATSGFLGQWEGPGIAEQILSIRARAEARGIAAGLMSRSVPDAIQRRDQGFKMIGVGNDAALIIRALEEALTELGGRRPPNLWF